METSNCCCCNSKDLVLKFYDLACNKKQVVEAANFLAEDYIQHNPFIANGKEGFITALSAFFVKYPKRQSQIQRVLTDNELGLVALHIKAINDPEDANDLGTAMIDIFRVENGLIVEHWDVVQPIPPQSVNGNKMV
jgi:predicted SnoaL-like aldol condensation-catalyzing enzyme